VGCSRCIGLADGFFARDLFYGPVWHLLRAAASVPNSRCSYGRKDVTEPLALAQKGRLFKVLERDWEGAHMSSSIKHIVEPTVGWLFMIVLIVALCAALIA
jgi:hypothetical protein